MGDIFDEDFGQKVDLTVRIKEILQSYPAGTSFLKELVQVMLHNIASLFMFLCLRVCVFIFGMCECVHQRLGLCLLLSCHGTELVLTSGVWAACHSQTNFYYSFPFPLSPIPITECRRCQRHRSENML